MTTLQSDLISTRVGCHAMSRLYRCHGMVVPLTARVRPGGRIGPLVVRCLAKQSKDSGTVRLAGRPAGERSGQTAVEKGLRSISAMRRMTKVNEGIHRKLPSAV
jgi:hypothetical protein